MPTTPLQAKLSEYDHLKNLTARTSYQDNRLTTLHRELTRKSKRKGVSDTNAILYTAERADKRSCGGSRRTGYRANKI